MKHFADSAARWLFTILMAASLILVVVFQFTDFAYKKEFLLPNWASLLIGLGVTALLLRLTGMGRKQCSRIKPGDRTAVHSLSGRAVWITTPCLFALQVFIAWNIFFITGWDSWTVLKAARTLAAGKKLGSWYSWYFSIFPNNHALLLYETLLLSINRALGLFAGDAEPFILVIANCALNTAACVLVWKTLKLYMREGPAFAGFVLSCLMSGLSPWNLVCYTDSLCIVFPILIFYLAETGKRAKGRGARTVRAALLALISAAAFLLKPQCIIMLIAILAVRICHELRKPKMLLREIVIGAVTLLCIFGLKTADTAILGSFGIEISAEESFGPAHYIMMGLNSESDGGFSADDFHFTANIRQKDERNAADLAEAGRRVKEMGPGGFLSHLARKDMVIFGDGTFAWGEEGGFYKEKPGLAGSPISDFLKSVYYTDEEGKLFPAYSTAMQAIWLWVLFFATAAGILSLRGAKLRRDAPAAERSENRAVPAAESVSTLMLAAAGIGIFELIFEARARYLYIYAPVFCILAVSGLFGCIKLPCACKHFSRR